jgi:1-acyl-sn-glycerol-3-phosphate acyltransferase
MEYPVWRVRGRLACLWLSQVARILADNCLRMFVVVEVARAGQQQHDAAWHQVTPFFILPFVLLAPLNGALSNALPKRWVLVGSSAFCLGVAVLFGLLAGAPADPWLWCAAVGLVAVGAAIYSPTRYALLPAAAEDGRLPLSRVNGFIEMGGATAVVVGLVLGLYLHDWSWPMVAKTLGWHGGGATWADTLQRTGMPVAVALTAALNLVGLLAAIPVCFPSDVRRSEPAKQAVAGFFRDCRRILRDQEARASVLGLACFLGLVTVGSGVLFTYTGGLKTAADTGSLLDGMVVIGIGAALGSFLSGLQGHLRRALGQVPFAVVGLLIALGWALFSADLTWPCLMLGIMGGLVTVPLRANYQAIVPPDARGNAMAVMNTIHYGLTAALAAVMFGLARSGLLAVRGQLMLLAILAAVGAFVAWRVLFRESYEQVLEVLLWPIYRMRGHGPGLDRFPMRGPVLVVANHSSWFDPAFLGKVLPRRFTAMMTSSFYDLPVLRWMARRVYRAIRVEASGYRREAPELRQAIAALDRGDCLVVFPEGAMRKRADQPLRRFGQGVWHILRERPNTPVVVCWIEGAWGSYFSYYNGSPTKNKRVDWWRSIDVAMNEPLVLAPALLADQRATRAQLMRSCLDARRHLGLGPLPDPSGEPVLAAEDQESS